MGKGQKGILFCDTPFSESPRGNFRRREGSVWLKKQQSGEAHGKKYKNLCFARFFSIFFGNTLDKRTSIL